MNHKVQRIYTQLFPYLLIGVVISVAVGLLIVLSSVLMWGILIGGMLWVGSLIKRALFPKETPKEEPSKGRIIEHNNDEKL